MNTTKAVMNFRVIITTFIFFLFITNTGFAEENKKNTKTIMPSNVCDYCVLQANMGNLNDIVIKTIPIDSPDISVPGDLSEIIFKNNIDINNDGVIERVFLENMAIGFSVFNSKTDEKIELIELWGYDWEEDVERWVEGHQFIEYQRVNYILKIRDEGLSHLVYINPRNEADVVCEFERREKPLILNNSENDKVCQLILQNQPSYVEFDKLHALSYEELRKLGFNQTGYSDKAAAIDIDNNGKNEMVVMLEHNTGGRCVLNYPAVLTEDRTSIDMNFMDKFPSLRECGRWLKPFISDDTVYLDEIRDGYRQIFKIDTNGIKTICKFDIEKEYFVKKQKGFADDWINALSQSGTEAVEKLIRKGKHLNAELKIQKKLKPYNRLPIAVALELKRDDILERLLEAGADPNYQEDEEGYSNLAKAVLLGSTQSVILLLKYGAKDNHSPLSAIEIATEQDSPEKLQLLLKAGIKREDQLKSEIINISLAKLEALLQSGAKIGDEAAIAAIEAKDTYKYERLKLMLKYGLNVNRIYAKHVIAEGITQKSPVVWEIGPEINTKKIEKTLLQWAKEVGDPEIINIFNRAGTK